MRTKSRMYKYAPQNMSMGLSSGNGMSKNRKLDIVLICSENLSEIGGTGSGISKGF